MRRAWCQGIVMNFRNRRQCSLSERHGQWAPAPECTSVAFLDEVTPATARGWEACLADSPAAGRTRAQFKSPCVGTLPHTGGHSPDGPHVFIKLSPAQVFGWANVDGAVRRYDNCGELRPGRHLHIVIQCYLGDAG